ncbi:MAG: hypothetical protein WBE58_22405, partial [Verrucomicrobiales bacterium]
MKSKPVDHLAPPDKTNLDTEQQLGKILPVATKRSRKIFSLRIFFAYPTTFAICGPTPATHGSWGRMAHVSTLTLDDRALCRWIRQIAPT